jgi:uncharacterized protein (TIGR03083 family)
VTTSGEHYRRQREAASELFAALSSDQLATPVPGCPDWTVRDALGHLVGLPADVSAGVMDNAGSPAWTGKQIADRSGGSVTDLLEEWDKTGPAFEDSLEGLGFLGAIFVMDVTMHLDDVREALGRPLGSSETEALVLDRLVKQAGKRAEGIGSLTLTAGEQSWTIGTGSPTTALAVADAQELSRVLGARRDDDTVRALDWTGDPEPWIPVLPLFREGR